MILNKNDKDQQQQHKNHFLSYSHQLPEQQHQLTNDIDITTANPPKANNNETRHSAGDVGGSDLNDSWKSSIMKQEQDSEDSRGKEFLKQKQSSVDNSSVDPGGGKPEDGFAKKSIEREPTDLNQNEQESSTVKSFGSTCEQSQMHLSNVEPNNGEKKHESEREKQSYTYNSAHEYQQHKNMVNSIKKEPFEEVTPGSVKYEGYEKNYQNFIRYADFCDAQQPQQYEQKQAPYQQDFIQPQAYYNNYPYQNYPPPSQNYSQQQTYQQFISQQAAYQQQHGHHSSSLTNFEQQIPLHTYPIPKQTPTNMSETMFSSANIKVEPSASQALHPSSENVSAVKEDCESFAHAEMPNMGDPCNVMTPKNEVRRQKQKQEHPNQASVLQPSAEIKFEDEPVSEPKATPQKASGHSSSRSKKQAVKDIYNERNNKPEVPDCDCFSSDKKPPEPGSYYTHLGL